MKAMFAKLRTRAHVKARSGANFATVEITGRSSARIATVHQFGLPERPEPGGRLVTYPVRQLLGINSQYASWLESAVLDRLGQ